MKATIFGGLPVAALAITSMAEAQSRTLVINQKHRRTERHITAAVRHGRISHMQANHLRREERYVMRERNNALAEHRMTRAERRRLRREEERVNRQLHRDVRADRVS